MGKKLLVIGKDQFGYLVGIYEYCEYLKSDYEITNFSMLVLNKIYEVIG